MPVAARPLVYPLIVEVEEGSRRSRRVALARPLLGGPVLVFSLLLNVGAAPAAWAAAALRGRVPRWLAVFQLSVLAWQTRALAYLLGLTDRFPAAGRDHPVCIECAEAGVARWKVLVWKLLTSLPHLLVLALLTVALVPAALLGWIAIALAGRLPRALQAYGTGVVAYGARIAAYLQSLTDAFPPFSLRCAPRPAHRATYVTCATVGLAPATLVMAVLVFIIGFSGTRTVVEVPYGGLRAGTVQTPRTEGVVESGRMALRSVRDPATLGPFAPPQRGPIRRVGDRDQQLARSGRGRARPGLVVSTADHVGQRCRSRARRPRRDAWERLGRQRPRRSRHRRLRGPARRATAVA